MNITTSVNFNLDKILLDANFDYVNATLREMTNNRQKYFNIENFEQTKIFCMNSCEQWLVQFDMLKRQFNSPRYRKYTTDVQSEETQAYQKQQYTREKNLLLKHLKDGYKIIHRIRELITNQEIIYNILVGNESKYIYEIGLDMDTLLEQGSFSTSHGYGGTTFQDIEGKVHQEVQNISLRLETSYTKLLKAANYSRLLEADKSEINEDNTQFIAGDTLYQDLMKYYYSKDANFNRGHVYEIYHYLTHIAKSPYNVHRHYKMNSILISALYQAVKNSTPSIQGGDTVAKNEQGDYIGVQLKNIINAAAGLMDSSSMVTWMKEICRIFSLNDKKQMQNEFIELFSQKIKNIQGLDQTMEKEANKAVIKGIKEIFSQI